MSLSFSNAKTSYTATSSFIYPIGFTYENQSEVKVRTQLTSGAYQEVTNWSFLGTTNIQFSSTPPATFEIYRATDISRSYGTPGYAVFRAGSQLNAGDLNKNFELLRRGIEENNAALSGLLFEDTHYFDETYVNVGGDKMTGNLVLGTTSSNNTTLSTDGSAAFSSKITTAATASSDLSTTVTTKGYVDSSVAAVPGTDLAYDSATRVVSSSTGTDATLPEVTAGGDSGLLTGADKTKLDGIETGATADQTDAEIKTAYENNADTNAFTDSEKTKLAGIETSATADQTGAEIKALYEVEANAFTDAQFTKLAGIETGATADQTDAEIKTAYENNADTNAFTDAEKTKLSGIAANAEVNAVTSVNTATGAVVLDADDIDDASTAHKFVTASDVTALGTLSSDLAGKADLSGGKLVTSQLPDIAISEYKGAVANQTAMLGVTGEKGDWVTRSDDGKVYVITGTDPSVIGGWTALSYPTAPDTDLSYDSSTRILSSSTGTDATLPEVVAAGDSGLMTGSDKTKLDGIESGATADQTAAEILTAIKTVDGATSGLDSDLLDGQHGSHYLDYSNFTNTPTIPTNNNQLTNGAGYVTSSGNTTIGTQIDINTNAADVIDTLTLTDGVITAHSTRTMTLGDLGYTGATNANYITNNNQLTNGAGYITSADGGNAATLDGIDSSQFLRSDIEESGTILNLNGGTGNGAGDATLYVTAGNNNDWGIKVESNGGKTEYGMTIDMPASYNYGFRVTSNGSNHFVVNSTGATIGGNYVWHGGNDGSGSGLDADLLDGMQAHTGRNNEANKVVRTDGNGYIQAGWINTTSGDQGSTVPSKIYASNDDYLRYYDLASMRSFMNVTAQTGYQGREQSTSDTGYWVGTMGWSNNNWNNVFHYGSGHIDGWDTPSNSPSNETTHWVGHQSLHYTNGSSAYGHQFLVGAGNPAYCYLRGRWGSSFTSWYKVWNSANDGSGSGLDADTLDGLQPSVSASSSTIVQRHSSGYIFANYFNTTPDDVTSGVTKVCVETGNDGYIRHGDAGSIRSFINVENGATADQTASEILTAIKTVDGSGSGLDADNLDGHTWSTYGKNVRATEFYADNWFRNYNAGEGLYNEGTGAHWASDNSGEWTLRDDDNTIAIRFRSNGTSTRGYVYANNYNEIGFLNDSGSWSWKMDSSGNGTATGNVTAYSDITLKENIEVIPNALDKVSEIRGVTYNRKDLEDNPRHAGVIAQEVEAVLPEVVSTDEDGIKSVAYGNLVGLLIEAVKELKVEVETLKAERN